MAKKYYNYEETHRTVKGVKQKRCTKCKKWKDESKSEFRKDRARKDGLVNRCKACDKAYERKRRRKNRKVVREYLRYEDRYRVVRGVKEKLCSRCKQWKYKSQFSRNRRSKDRLQCQCKDCESKYARKRYERNRKGARRNFRYEDCHRIVNEVKEKLCSKCEKWKKESLFYQDRSGKDGLTGRCKACSYKATNKSRKKRRLAV